MHATFKVLQSTQHSRRYGSTPSTAALSLRSHLLERRHGARHGELSGLAHKWPILQSLSILSCVAADSWLAML